MISPSSDTGAVISSCPPCGGLDAADVKDGGARRSVGGSCKAPGVNSARSGNKALIRLTAKASGVPSCKVRDVLIALAVVIAREMEAGRTITIQNVGRFITRFRKGRTITRSTWAKGHTRQIRTITQPSAFYVKFQPSTLLSYVVKQSKNIK